MSREPLTPLSMHLLLALAHAPMHGYALMQKVEEESGGAVKPGTGSLYAALQRLVDDGLIEVAGEREGRGRRGPVYAITGTGADAVRHEARRLRGLLARVAERDLLPDPERS